MPTQNSQFGYITWLQLRQSLTQRLNDPTNIFWADAENQAYLIEALRFWNVLTCYWPQDMIVTVSLGGDWATTSNTGSPRQQTLTESDLYSILCYQLMEPQMTGGTWNGTNQFDTLNLQTSTQYTRDEILQQTAVNIGVLTTGISFTPNTSRLYLPDNVLDVRRVRYNGQDGTARTLVRGDSNSFMRFSKNYRQDSGTPRRYDVLGSPPLALTVDKLVNQPNTLELLVMQAGNTLNPGTPQPLQIPNDWLFLLKYGVLSDLLSNEPESTDWQRSNYCRKRYDEGLKIVQNMPWLLNGYVDNVAVDCVPIIAKDRYAVDWQTNPDAWLSIVVGGFDVISVAPTFASGGDSGFGDGGFNDGGFGDGGGDPVVVSCTVVGNAPIPIADGDFVQAPRDVIDVLLDYAQHVAKWKCGGDEFFETMPLYENFIKYAMETNARLRMSGIFATDLRPPVSKQDLEQPRFAVK